jgi:hypothetical protein
VGEGGLADPGNVFDQQVAAGEQAGEGQPQRLGLAEDDAIEGRQCRRQRRQPGFRTPCFSV